MSISFELRVVIKEMQITNQKLIKLTDNRWYREQRQSNYLHIHTHTHTHTTHTHYSVVSQLQDKRDRVGGAAATLIKQINFRYVKE